MNARTLDDMPPDALRRVIDFQGERLKRYEKLFIDGREPGLVEVAETAPELCIADFSDVNPDRLWEDYQEHQAKFDTTPFDPVGHKFRLYPGGVTIWSGAPGTGKTTILRQQICQLLKRGRGVFVASLEEPPSHMLVRLWMTAAGTTMPDSGQRDWFMHQYCRGQLRMWGKRGLASHKAIFDTMRYAIREGCSHAVIDSLTCLDIGAGDWEQQRVLIVQLCALAVSTDCHIHLVAHPRKPQKGDAVVDIADVAGSSDFGRLVDNVVFVRRDIDNESDDFTKPTAMQVVVRKQRHGTGWCGKIQGFLHRDRKQFTESQLDSAISYLPENGR